jgi:hypothetical protein
LLCREMTLTMRDLAVSPPNLDLASAEAPAEKMWWDRSIFISDEQASGGSCPPVIDVTGRARILVHGPNQKLPAGVWRATVFLHLSPDAAHRRIGVQFGPEPDYTTVDLPLGVAGDHKVELTLTAHEAQRYQIRLWLKKAAFHGEIRFAGASVERIADLPPATPNQASTEDV